MTRRKRKKRSKKNYALRVHSFRKGVERYPDLDITDEVRAKIIEAIQAGKSTPVEKQTLRVSIHDVELEPGLIVRVAYDKKRGRIITFLHRDPGDYCVLDPPSKKDPTLEDWLKSGPEA